MALQVQKKDGSTEDWDKSKLVNSVLSAGISSEEAEGIGVLMENWAERTYSGTSVKTTDLRNKVLELLHAVNPSVAQTYESYKKV
jgi:transcriptional regulator NrdR family protein